MSLEVRAAALLQTSPQRPVDTSVRGAGREFEAYFVAEMLRAASRSPFGDSPLSGGASGRMYREQFQAEVARQAALAGGLGLAAWIEGRLETSEEGGS